MQNHISTPRPQIARRKPLLVPTWTPCGGRNLAAAADTLLDLYASAAFFLLHLVSFETLLLCATSVGTTLFYCYFRYDGGRWRPTSTGRSSPSPSSSRSRALCASARVPAALPWLLVRGARGPCPLRPPYPRQVRPERGFPPAGGGARGADGAEGESSVHLHGAPRSAPAAIRQAAARQRRAQSARRGGPRRLGLGHQGGVGRRAREPAAWPRGGGAAAQGKSGGGPGGAPPSGPHLPGPTFSGRRCAS